MGRLRQVLMVSPKFPLRPSENFPPGVQGLRSLSARSLSLPPSLSKSALSLSGLSAIIHAPSPFRSAIGSCLPRRRVGRSRPSALERCDWLMRRRVHWLQPSLPAGERDRRRDSSGSGGGVLSQVSREGRGDSAVVEHSASTFASQVGSVRVVVCVSVGGVRFFECGRCETAGLSSFVGVTEYGRSFASAGLTAKIRLELCGEMQSVTRISR